MNYDLIIVGGGPAGAAAGVYAARKHIKTALIAESFGGQSVESDEIQNWIGTVAISGMELAKNLKNHVKHYAGEFVEIKEGEKVTDIVKDEQATTTPGFLVTTNKGTYKTKTLLIATGGQRRRLTVPGASEFEGKGITYCASCDGPFYEGKDVVVVGGGNAGFESAAQLLAYCKSVTLLERNERYGADPVTVEKVLSHPHVKALSGAEIVAIKGDQFTKSIVYRQKGQEVEMPVDGVFVEIGHVPATSFCEGLLDLDELRRIKVDHRTQSTGTEGVWAAGDCTDAL